MVRDLGVIINKVNTLTSVDTSKMSSEVLKKLNDEIDGLFAPGNKYYSTGTANVNKDAIELQIKRLKEEIEVKQERIEDIYCNKILKGNVKISGLMEKITQGFVEISAIDARTETLKNDNVRHVQGQVLFDYLTGKIGADEIGDKICEKLSGEKYTKMGANAIKSILNGPDGEGTRDAIAALIGEISGAKTEIGMISMQIQSSNKMVTALEAMLKIQTPQNGNTLNPLGSKPLYTAGKLDLIESIAARFGKDVVAGGSKGDKYNASNNAQLKNMGQALGNGDIEKSILKEMYNKGFTYREAAYAMSWLFNDSGISYDAKSNNMTVAYGHGGEAAAIYSSLTSQMQKLWGANLNGIEAKDNDFEGTDGADGNGNDTNDGGVNGGNGGNGLNAGGGLPGDGAVDENLGGGGGNNRIDPIGFNNGNTSFDFVTDANNDGIFNGIEEFLGATVIKLSEINDDNMDQFFSKKLLDALKEAGKVTCADDLKQFSFDGGKTITGMGELFMYDIDGNGKIELDELENLMVLKTVQTKGNYSFMDAKTAGVSEVDLTMFQVNGVYDASTLKQGTKVDINGNITENKFGVTLQNGREVSGYQRLDDVNYLNKMYGGSFGSQYYVSFKKSENENGETVIDLDKGATELASARAKMLEVSERLKTAQAEVIQKEAARSAEIDALSATGETWVLSQGQLGADQARKQPEPEDVEFQHPYHQG